MHLLPHIRLHRLFWLAGLALLIGLLRPLPVQAQTALAPSAVVTTPEVRAELLAYAPQGVAPGQPLWLGLQFTHQPHWHTYWKNPGDSGLATQLDWQLPAGLQAGAIAWPVPRKIPIGTLANYGYEGQVLLPAPVQVTPEFAAQGLPASITVRLKASWLVCRQECIPQEGEFALTLPTQGSSALHAPVFDAARRQAPQPLPGSAQLTLQGQTLALKVSGLPATLQGKTLSLFPETAEVVDNAAAIQQSWQGSDWLAQVPVSAQRSASPGQMSWVVASPEGSVASGVSTVGWQFNAELRGQWPPSPSPAAVSPALQAALDSAAASAKTATAADTSLGWPVLLSALLGGLILNLMPCVFPVLALKIFGFAQHGHNRRQLLAGGLAYTAGVVLSFMALGGLLLALRAGGEAVGWGFQLQSPLVVAGLATLFTVIGLNLAGLFEFGQMLPSGVAALQARNPILDSLLSGVLAVAVASPCTAPFMGASLGLAVSLPGWQALSLFATLGLGLALPYLLASAWPGLARLLPRPGAWMDTFRRFMAFPMLATVVWLIWVLGQQISIDGVAAVLAGLLALAMLLWALGLPSRSRWALGGVAGLALLGIGQQWGHQLLAVPTSVSASAPASEPLWQAWAPGAVEQRLAQGQAVFVDYTAAWCITCQYNKKTTLADAGLLAAFAQKNIALLRADWTRRDPAITAALSALGRSGVPVYVLHVPGQPPVVLSEVISVSDVRAALDRI